MHIGIEFMMYIFNDVQHSLAEVELHRRDHLFAHAWTE
jgi:hypothetical protein